MNTKLSTALSYLETHEVFTLEEYMAAVDPTVSVRTRYDNLQNAVKRGYAYRVRRGLYASNLGVYRDRVPNVFLIATKTAASAVITHHSALEAHGVAHSPLRTVYFTSARRIESFEVRGYRLHSVLPPASVPAERLKEYVTRARVGAVVVPVSTSERTLVDCLGDIRLAGGLEELLRSLGGFPTMAAARVAAYAELLASPTLTARAGWTLEQFARRWRLDRSIIDLMTSSVGRGTYWLVPGSRHGRQEFVSRWRLNVPAGLPLQEWISG